MNWLWYAILGTLSLSGMFLTIKKLGLLGVKTGVILVYLFVVAGTLFLLYNLVSKNNIIVKEGNVLMFLILVGIFSFLGNFFSTKSIISAPNPGYSLVITSFNIVLITVASYFLFKSELTTIKLLGMVIALIGLIIVAL